MIKEEREREEDFIMLRQGLLTNDALGPSRRSDFDSSNTRHTTSFTTIRGCSTALVVSYAMFSTLHYAFMQHLDVQPIELK